MKSKKQLKIIIILFIILVNIFAIKDTSELLSKLELNTIVICDAQAFVDLNVTLQIDVENYKEFDYLQKPNSNSHLGEIHFVSKKSILI